MSTVINTNVKAMISTSALVQNGRSMRSTMESLSTGSRINQASDDAAGLSIRENMTAQINGLNAAVRNANDGISMLQTADGALNEVAEMLQRMRELGTLAQNDTYSTAQRVAMNDEFAQLQAEIDRIAGNTQWNSMDLLDGTGGQWGGGSVFSFQVGANAGQTIAVTVANMDTTSLLIDAVSIGTVTTAQSAVSALDDAISILNTRRSIIGAGINRLTHAIDNLTNVAQNASESRSRITDTDYATATSELARSQIIQQAGMAMLAQANQQPQIVLSLLR
jgi:flagellin